VGELEDWLDEIATPAYWRELVPELSVCDAAATAEPLVRVDDELLTELRSAMLTEGYFQFEPLIPAPVLAAMAAGVRALHEASIPLGFAYVYDEFWHLNTWLAEVLAALLGDEFAQLPDFWAWFVEAGSSGWEPHREKGPESLLANGYPKSLSLWVPLTDATPLNGCMYIVPANLDPGYNGKGDDVGVQRLQDVRALPARAGSVLMWNQDLLHWGGASSQHAPHPRISFSIEYQRGDIRPFNVPLLDPRKPPPAFEHRLGLAGKQILQYEHLFSRHPTIVTLAHKLLARFSLDDL